jgi:signal transduction histidine kinase/ligand-binding sensor domain-containing protein
MQGQYYFDQLTEENGLSDNRVTCFMKDRTGFLWIGTKNGLNRFDGNSYKVFKPAGVNSISSEEINDIVQDTAGKIWVATMNGINSYDPQKNRWETMMPNEGDTEDGLPNYLVWDLYADEQNRIWIVSDVWEFSVYDPASKKFTFYDWPACKEQRQFDTFPAYRSIHKIARKTKTSFWLATTIGLFSLDIQSGKFQFHGAGFTGSIKDLQYDTNNKTVYLVTEQGKVYCYDEKTGLYTAIKVTSQPYPAVHWERNSNQAGKLQLAHPAGLLEVNKTNRQATIIVHQPTWSSTLLPGGTNTVYPDNNGILWAGTNNGISFCNTRNDVADFIPLSVASDKESTDGMSAVLYDETENKYFVTALSGHGVFIIDRRSGQITAVKTMAGKLPGACTNICRDRQNNIWLLTETNIYRYNRVQKNFDLFPTPNGNKPVIFHDLVEDKQGNYWLATWREGVYLYKSKEKKFHRFAFPHRIAWFNATSLMNDPVDSTIWIGSFNGGVSRYDPQAGIRANYFQNGHPEYAQLNLIRDITQDATGKIWLVTHGAGIFSYQHGKANEKAFTQLTTKNGLTNSSYHAITSDNKNRLWLLSSKGLSVIDHSGKFLFDVPRHPALSFANYAPDVRFPKRIGYNKINNELLIPVAGGLLIYYPDKVVKPVLYSIVLTDMSIGGRSVIYDSLYTGEKNIAISYKQNSLSFQIAALNYTGNAIQYEYKLHKNDTEWKSISASNTLNFPDLPPGYYTFMVRGRDATGHLSSNTLLYSFHIIPPFWKTGWFIALLLLLTGYGLYLWTVYLRRKIKAQKILNYFATSLYGQNTVEEIFWDVAKNCISKLQLEDCMIYLFDTQRQVLVQKAAYGPKNPVKHEITNPIEIPLGKGIVGTVAQTGKAEIIANTSKDKRYIVDDERRYSEITVPIFVDGKIFGIIDSEHPKKNYYRKYHLKILQDIATVCSNKISKYIIEERLRAKISRDLHDEIGSALTSINVLSKVAISKAANDAGISSYLSKIKDSTHSTMESMSDIVWAINPKNDKLEALMSRMKEFAADICEAQQIDLCFILPPELENCTIDLATRKNLFLIFKEAVNNAVKHSGCTLLQVKLEQINNQLRMTIKDNGKGFDKTTVSHGNGLYNMQERVAECNGTLLIQSGLQQGTEIILEIPIPFFGVSTKTGTY